MVKFKNYYQSFFDQKLKKIWSLTRDQLADIFIYLVWLWASLVNNNRDSSVFCSTSQLVLDGCDFRDRQESNPGLLGEKRKRYLCAMKSSQKIFLLGSIQTIYSLVAKVDK